MIYKHRFWLAHTNKYLGGVVLPSGAESLRVRCLRNHLLGCGTRVQLGEPAGRKEARAQEIVAAVMGHWWWVSCLLTLVFSRQGGAPQQTTSSLLVLT